MILSRPTLALGLLLLAAAAAGAQDPAPPPGEPARFLIERITVEGPKEAAANIVRAETLLREGETYTEAELRQAVYRVQRLPFVLDAGFSLRKGSQRGAYELAIEIQQPGGSSSTTTPLAFAFDQPLDLGTRRSGATVHLPWAASREPGISWAARAWCSPPTAARGSRRVSPVRPLPPRHPRQRRLLERVLRHRGGPLPWLDPILLWSFGTRSRSPWASPSPLPDDSVHFAWSERRGQATARNEVLGPSPPVEPPRSPDGELTYRRAEAKWVWDTSDDPALPTRGTRSRPGSRRPASPRGT